MNTKYILNIGRKVGGRKTLLRWSTVIKAVELASFDIVAVHEYAPVGGEPTLVIECSRSYHRLFAELELVSDGLRQDCIAIWNGTSGALVGPRSAKWGPFKAEHFILPNGNTLESALQ